MYSIARVHTYARYYFIVLVSLFVTMVTSYRFLFRPIIHFPFMHVMFDACLVFVIPFCTLHPLERETNGR